MSDETHLFGTVGAENLHQDLTTAYEMVESDWLDDAPPDEVIIEEWTATPLAYTQIDYLTEHIAERVGEEGDEWMYEALDNAGRHPDVVAAFQVAVDLMLSKCGYRMADKCIARHIITHDAEGRPMLNGEPLFPKVSE